MNDHDLFRKRDRLIRVLIAALLTIAAVNFGLAAYRIISGPDSTTAPPTAPPSTTTITTTTTTPVAVCPPGSGCPPMPSLDF